MRGDYDTLEGGSSQPRSFFQRFKFPLIAGLVLIFALLVVFVVVFSARLKSSTKAWENQVDVDNIMNHLQQFQYFANNNSGNRAAGTSGYEASLSYVVDLLHEHTDYEVSVQNFTFTSTVVNSASNLTISSDGGCTSSNFDLAYNTDYRVMGGGSSEYNLQNVSTSLVHNYGCYAEDYASVVAGTIALIKRGNCTFQEKANLAEAKQPVAVIIYNEGNTPDRMGVFSASVSNVNVLILSVSYYSGVALMTGNVTLSASTSVVTQTTSNIIADTKSGRHDRVIVIGSHLDSVPAGPGINDNGSGSALNIELALMLATSDNQKRIENKIRFCWFGAEEIGLLGSTYYVQNLNNTDKIALANISVNLNFDMIGSPNFFRGVYNGSSDLANGNGSAVVQRFFNDYFNAQNIPFVPTEFSGRSDYGPFLDAKIPAGGLFTGAEVVKPIHERQIFGGLAGASYDPCYHQACDNIDNINQQVLTEMSMAAAHVLEQLAINEDLHMLLSVL